MSVLHHSNEGRYNRSITCFQGVRDCDSSRTKVSLHCRTVSFHDFITDHYGGSYIMHLYMYISMVHMFIRTISLMHSYLTIRLCCCVLKQYSMKSFHTMQNGFFIHPRNWHYCLGILEKKGV